MRLWEYNGAAAWQDDTQDVPTPDRLLNDKGNGMKLIESGQDRPAPLLLTQRSAMEDIDWYNLAQQAEQRKFEAIEREYTAMTTDETTAIVRTFLDDYDQLPAEIPGAATLEPGRINWYHGVKQAKLPGVFYARDTAFVDVPPAPWALDERYSDQGELGYCAARLNIAVLGWREQWFTPGENRGDSSTWLPTYMDGAKKLTEYLIRVEGLDDPMVLSVSGLYKAKPIVDLVSAFRRGALLQAMRKTRKNLPLWAFWLPIASRTKDGKIEYLEAKDADGKEYGSVVTPPALAGPPIARSVAEIMADAETWKEFKDSGWFDYKRLPRDTTEASYTVSTAPQLPPGRNVPVPIDEDDAF